MYSSIPRQVTIGDAATFVGTTPRAIRHYHSIGLLPEPARGSDNRRRYGYDDMIRLLWVRRMADAGVALDDIRAAFADSGANDVAGILDRLDDTLTAHEAKLQRQRSALQRMRARGSKLGLLSDFVASRLENLPENELREADLDTLLVTERIFGPLGAAVQATRFIALARNPDLRAESDRVDAAEETLDDSVSVDDPRVEQIAGERHAFEKSLHAFIEKSGLAQADDDLIDASDALPDSSFTGQSPMSPFEAVKKMAYDFSPARVRCMELADELAARDA